MNEVDGRSRWRRLTAHPRRVALTALVALVWVVGALVALRPGRHVDLLVYRAAGEALRHGDSLYAAGFPHGRGPALPFTYPPFAAVVLGLLSFLSPGLAVAVMTGLGLLLLGATAWLSWRAAPWPSTRPRQQAYA
ncbi:MAG: glycosyltransferase 87 family protein, partial [Lapillicoccus sp.]